MLYNKIFDWYLFLISRRENHILRIFQVIEVTLLSISFWDHTWIDAKRWDDFGFGLLTRKTNHMIRQLALKRGQWFNQPRLFYKTPLKTLEAGAWWSFLEADTSTASESGVLTQGAPSRPGPRSIWLVLICIIYNKHGNGQRCGWLAEP